MSGTPWARFTPEQQRAAFLVDTHVLASAGAGSGKTAVMAVRYVACLLARAGDQQRITPDRILALAFTNEAAGNLRARIDRTLRAVLRHGVFPRLAAGEQGSELADLQLDEDARGHLRRCLAALPGAPITTVDGACLTWVTEGAAQLGRDPDHAPAENLAWARVRLAAWQALCRTQTADLAPLIERYGEHNVRTSLIGRADQAAALPGGDAVLDALDPYAELLRRRSAELAQLPLVIGAAQAVPGKGKVWEYVQSLTTVVPSSPAGLISWLEAIDEAKVHASNPELAEQVRLLQDLLDAPVSRSAEGKRPDPGQRRGGATLGSLRDWSPALEQELTVEAGRVVRLLAALRETIAVESARAGVAGFAAIEVDALRLLQDSKVAARLARRYRHVLLDEAQDLNRLQARLIEALQTADGPRVFTVGDHRQSIFGFRHAAPEIFGRWEAELVGRGGTVATLRENFRSHPDLVRQVTGLFAVEAFRPQDIQPGRIADGEAVLAAHVVLSGDPDPAAKDDPAELQAAFIAERIATSARPPEEHAILLRSRTRMALYARALERRGLPCDTDFPEGLVDSQEVHDIEAVLRLAANPADRTALAIALGGPWGTVDPQDKRLLVTALESDPASALRETPLGGLLPLVRARAASEGPASAVRALATDPRLTARYGALPLARRRLANLMLLAEEEQRAGQVLDLAAFCARLRERRAHGVDEATASGAALGGRGVRLMTIHGAKGLEWPVVWLPGLDRPHNQRDLAQPVLAIPHGDHLRIACRPETRPGEVQPVSLRAGLLADDLRVRAIGEERRLFYVACTRAREELHLLAGKVPSAPDARQLTSSLGGWVSGAGSVPWSEELVDLQVVTQAPVPPPPRIPASVALPLPDAAAPDEVRSVTDLVEDDEVGAALGAPGALGYEATIARLVGTTIHEGFARCGCGMSPGQADEILAPLVALLPAARLARLRTALTAADLVPGYWAGERLVEQPLIGELAPGRVLTAQPDLLLRDAAGWHLYDFKTGAAAERASSRLQVRAYAWLVAPLLDAPLVDAWLIDVEGRRRLPVACDDDVQDELLRRWNRPPP